MKHLLVTGGAGFIGSNFVHYWLTNHPADRVVNLDALTYAGNLENLKEVEANPNYHFVQGDICDAAGVSRMLEDEKIDAVVNFAAESHVDRSILGPEAFIKTNVHGTFTLLEAARQYWGENETTCRFLHVSTDEVYGSLGPDDPPFTELTPYAPNSPYSASKAASDHLVRAYFHTYGLPVLTTNCSNNYGPYQFPEKLIPLVIINALEDKPLPIYGDGMNIRDWLHVSDHCRGIDTVLHKGMLGETYNIGGCNEWTNINIVRLVCAHLDELRPTSRSKSELITYVTDRAGHDRRYAIDASKIMQELGWAPEYSFEVGIEQTIHWYLENKSWWERIRQGVYSDYYAEQYGG
jgi:dTDP-glucose 4,6-dehydratase